ncbi:TonB-dependent receptor [Sphingobacterium sp. HJSM2_6]|uniref:TonB-dependent receptor n=1 Tax=Sphingobacterium sp. HJSM2_6 TaxID=3366264 RepID=UPI003BBBBEFF
MKIIIVLLLISYMQVSGGVFGQRISLSNKQVKLAEVFSSIEKQTGYTFFYNKADLQSLKPITVSLKNAAIADALTILFSNQPLGFEIHDKIIVVKAKKQVGNTSTSNSTALAMEEKQQLVEGRVIDSLNNPLQGVSIFIKGTSIGVATDQDGRFKLEAPLSAVLIFRTVGYYEKEISLSNYQLGNIILQAEQANLDEVVVLGFGQSQRKIAQTGSTASIGLKELKQSPTANVTNALAGRLPGLTAIQVSGEPGNDRSQLLIRGRATVNGAEPLITIDGVQKDYAAIGLLDVNEIENITILKDASATAIYGVKGANGVIIVTTRRGREGTPSISASLQSAVQNTIRLPDYLGSYEYALLANEAYLNDNPGGTVPYSDLVLEAYRTGSDPLKYPNVDWFDAMMKPARQSQANFNISGGSKLARYFVNVGYTDQGGIYKTEKNKQYDPASNFKRYNFRSNIDVDFDENFSIGLNLYGAIENKRDPNVSVPDLFWTLNQLPPNSFPVQYPTGFYGENGLFLNPARLLNQTGYREAFNSSLSGMLSLTRKLNFITEGLSVKGNYSFDGYFQNNFNRSKQVRRAVYKGSGDYDDESNYTYLGSDIPLSAPSSSYTQNRDIWMDASLNYQRKFGQHEVTGLVLVNRTQKVLGNTIPFVSQGIVSRITYNYQNKYFAEMNAGYNGTDNFAKDKRYGLFPAFSAGWVLSEESFLKDNTWLSFLKLRGSYGLTGNDQLTGRRWLFNSEYIRNPSAGYLYGDQLYGVEGVYEGAMANPGVTWETAKKSNLGLEVKLWGDLFSITADLFNEKRERILITRSSVPAIIGMSGGNLPPSNLGKVDNKGYEIELGHRKSINAFSYFVKGNMSYARNIIRFLDEESKPHDYMRITGQRLGQIMGLTAIGFFKDEMDVRLSPTQFGRVIPGDVKYLDRNGDDVINDNDMGPIGNSNIPEVFFGISGGFNWKNFDMSFLFQGAAKSSRTIVGGLAWEFYEGGKVRREHLNRWTPETAETATWPALHYGGNSNNHRMSSFFLEDNSYIRLKNVELGYTFRNVQVTKKAQFSSIRVYANGNNLYTWTRAQKMLDPEYWAGNTIGAIYPAQRVLNFGLSVGF